MKNFKPAVITLLVAILCVPVAQASVLSFKEWKSRRVAEKTSIVSQVKRDKSLESDERKIKLDMASQNLKIEMELSAEDYFQMYVMERFQGHPEKVREAVLKMSKDDLVTIIQSYSDLLNQVRGINTNSNPQQTAL